MRSPQLIWLAGDHHVHTHHSHDGTYSVSRQAEAAARHGLDWLVITDHGGPDHLKCAVGPTHADVLHARDSFPELLLFQGLEWNIPGSEHGTVFFAPSPHEAGLLAAFERQFDGMASSLASTPVDGLRWMADQARSGATSSALFLVNHPSRRGLVSPAQLRAWNDVCPDVAVGMEGAPGHQAAGQCGEPRGIYDQGPTAGSFASYPPASYRTFGGFDWMTATVGGVWDSLLAEGRRWWVTANSDSHAVARGPGATAVGRDFWPGAYSRTVVGAAHRSYQGVMEGIRRGRMWVVHGDLIWSLDVLVGSPGFADHQGVPLGGRAAVDVGEDVEVRLRVGLPKTPNGSGWTPRLARVDLISGPVDTGVRRPDALDAPGTAVVASFDVERCTGEITLAYTFRSVRRSFYLSLNPPIGIGRPTRRA